jgi:hypothetical protein
MLSNHIWGPHYWFFLFTVATTYPNNPNDISKKKYYELIQNFPLFIPNVDVSEKFSKLLDKYPVTPYLDSKDMFMRWIHFIHNRINITLGKKQLSYEDALNKYYQHYKSSEEIEDNFNKYKKIIVFVFTILILIFLSYCFYYN